MGGCDDVRPTRLRGRDYGWSVVSDHVITRLLRLGALGVVLGAFLPWGDGDGAPVFGIDLGAGRTALLLGLAGACAALVAQRGSRRPAGLVALAAGVGIALLALARLEGADGSGPGVVVAVGGAVALVHGGLQALRPRPAPPA